MLCFLSFVLFYFVLLLIVLVMKVSFLNPVQSYGHFAIVVIPMMLYIYYHEHGIHSVTY